MSFAPLRLCVPPLHSSAPPRLRVKKGSPIFAYAPLHDQQSLTLPCQIVFLPHVGSGIVDHAPVYPVKHALSGYGVFERVFVGAIYPLVPDRSRHRNHLGNFSTRFT